MGRNMVRTEEFTKDSKNTAKGRNGYFQPHKVTAANLLDNDSWQVLLIEISSKRVGNHAPLALHLTRENAEILRDIITKSLRETKDGDKLL